MQIKSRKILSKKDKKNLQEVLMSLYGEKALNLLTKTVVLEEVRTDDGKFYVQNRKIWFFIYNSKMVPSIYCLRETSLDLPSVVVDIGAIKFVTNGADIMAPGVVFFDDNIKEGTVVCIREEKANTILSVGLSLIPAKYFSRTKKGKVVKNIHYINDQIWNFHLP
ncbi:MAG: PUA domain-containing protein [Candidatus Heimdallarchaeaceae archaeon]